MDEDILSDVVPSNIVSRQVGSELTSRGTAFTHHKHPAESRRGRRERV
jgi:hypothetical protein